MNILLICPEYPDTFWSFKHALKFISKKASNPPLGLLTVAAMLPAEWGRRVVDLNVRKLKKKDLDWADMVFLTGMAVQKASAEEVIVQCREAGVKIAAGGPLFTSEQEHFGDVDYLVLNEAEITLPLFLADLERGTPKRIYEADGFADIQTTPAPAWELIDMRKYASMSVQYSRGCPYNCEFCNVTALFGHKPRTKTAGQITLELDRIYSAGWRQGVFFVDDNFIGNKRLLKNDLLPALIDWKKGKTGIRFHTEVSINLADHDDLMEMMVEAGFDTVFIGIETPDEEGLTECSKNQNRGRDLLEDVKKIQRAGLQVQAGFIIGFDSDTPSIFQRQIDFIQKSGIVTAMVGLLQAPPGTKLYERLKKEGRLLGRMTGDNADGTTNIVPAMSFDTLKEGYRHILRHIYSPENYYKRVKTFLREFRPPKGRARLTFQEMAAFFRSTYHLGIISRGRLQYWKLLLWARFRRPELFPLAVTLWIYGYHFRRVCELHVLQHR